MYQNKDNPEEEQDDLEKFLENVSFIEAFDHEGNPVKMRDESKKSPLESGIYVPIDGEVTDLVYEASDAQFWEWFKKNGLVIFDKTPDMPLTPKTRYKVIQYFEEAGGSICKYKDKWDEFEERMESLEGE